MILIMYNFRLVCECILNCDKLQYQLEDFWIECFVLIRHIIGGVDYKGVREIMKASISKFCVNLKLIAIYYFKGMQRKSTNNSSKIRCIYSTSIKSFRKCT